MTSTQTIAWARLVNRLGVFDFTGDQYFSWVRGHGCCARHRREINNTRQLPARLTDSHRVNFQRQNAAPNGNWRGSTEGIIAGKLEVHQTPPRRAPVGRRDRHCHVAHQDGRIRRRRPEVYPLAQACQDRLPR
jgi:hypothetical protein